MRQPARVTLVLGGARSGKSSHAETLARQTGLRRYYIATAEALDDEMRDRVAHHRKLRDADGWITLEEPVYVVQTIRDASGPDRVVLVDCLTLWLSNLMLGGHTIEAGQQELLEALKQAKGPIVLVSNEIGLGIVPETPLGRRFRDAQGRLNQAIAAEADMVLFLAAGLPLTLKQP